MGWFIFIGVILISLAFILIGSDKRLEKDLMDWWDDDEDI